MDAGADADVIASHLLHCGPAGRPRGQRAAAAARPPTRRSAARPHTAAAYLERALRERAPGDDRGRMLSQLAHRRVRRRSARFARAPARGAARGGRTATAASTCSRASPRSTSSTSTTPGCRSCSRRSWPPRPTRRRGWRSRPPSLDALMMLPEPPRRAGPARGGDRSRRDRRPALRRTSSPTARGSGPERGTPRRGGCAALALEALEGDELLHDAWRRRAPTTSPCGARAHRPRRRGPRAIARLREHAVGARLAAPARGGVLVRGRARAARAVASPRPRTTRGWSSTSSTRTSSVLTRRRGGGPRRGARRARRVRRGARAAAERGLDGALDGIVLGGERAPRPRPAVARRGRLRARAGRGAARAARCARSRAARTRRWTPWRSTAARRWPTSGAATRRRRSPTPSWRWPSASARRCRSPARCTPAPSPSPTTPRASRCASGRSPSPPARPRLLEAVRAAARARQHAGLRWAAASRRARRCAPRWPTPTPPGAVLLAERARRELVATGLRPRQAALEGAAALTPRQRQICELAAAGKGNRAIAQELFLSIKTVETHLAAGYRKLGVSTRAELADTTRVRQADGRPRARLRRLRHPRGLAHRDRARVRRGRRAGRSPTSSPTTGARVMGRS